MLKSLRNNIEKHRNSNKLGWRFLVFLKDLIWKCYNRLRTSIARPYCYLKYNLIIRKNNPILRELIKDKRILIVGSGPSAAELRSIPKDVKTLTCNAGLKLFVGHKFDKEIEIYLCHKKAMIHEHKDIEVLFAELKTKIFIIDDLKYIKERKELKKSYSRLIKDGLDNNYYLKRLIKPYKVKQIRTHNVLWEGSQEEWTSSAMRLLQYALYFKAKEIYLIGVDLNENGYFWGGKNIHVHSGIDKNFIKIISKKYNNIYSLSKNSPLAKYVKYNSQHSFNSR